MRKISSRLFAVQHGHRIAGDYWVARFERDVGGHVTWNGCNMPGHRYSDISYFSPGCTLSP